MQVMFTAQKIKFSIKGFFTKLAKSAGNWGFGHIYSRNPQWKTSFFVRFFLNILDNSNYCLDKTWWNNSDRRIKGGKRIRREWFEFSTKKSKYLYTFTRDEDDGFQQEEQRGRLRNTFTFLKTCLDKWT